MKIIGAPQGTQYGLIHPVSQSIHLIIFLPLLTQLQIFYINDHSEAQHWEEAQSSAVYLYPQAFLVDQRYHGIPQLVFPICKGLRRLYTLLPHFYQSPPWWQVHCKVATIIAKLLPQHSFSNPL